LSYLLRFPGQIFDSQTALHQNYFRDFDPLKGGYNEADPLGLRGGINTYAYVRNNPITLTDPTGLETGPAYAAIYKLDRDFPYVPVDSVFCSAGNCGAAWGLDESKGQQQYKYTKAPNLHIQLVPPRHLRPTAPNAIPARCKPGICSK
jgi:RHS repeat-associated protein